VLDFTPDFQALWKFLYGRQPGKLRRLGCHLELKPYKAGCPCSQTCQRMLHTVLARCSCYRLALPPWSTERSAPVLTHVLQPCALLSSPVLQVHRIPRNPCPPLHSLMSMTYGGPLQKLSFLGWAP
jgi:hypothetical protein